MTATPTNLTFVGIGKETTKGTGVVPVDFLPLKSFDPLDVPIWFDDTGMRGSMVDSYGEIQGPIYSEIDMAGDVFPDTVGYPFVGILGDLTVTGASPPYTTAAAVKNSPDGQPTAYSFTDFYGLTGGTPARRYPGCQYSELGLKWQGDGMFEFTAKAVGYQSAQVAKPTPSFTAIPPAPGWLGTLTIGGSSKLFMESGSLDLKRNASPIHTVDGTQAPYQIFVGELVAEGKLVLIHEDDTELQRMLNATQAATVFNWQTGAGASLVQVQITMTKPQYKVAAIKRGKDYVTCEIDYKAIANTTDVGASGGYSPLKVTIQNAKASGTYA